MNEEIIKNADDRMAKTVVALRHELNTIRTGRATPALLEKISVDAYGSPMPIEHVAKVSVPDPRSLLITPFDRGLLSIIEKAIQKSDIGLTPNSDGTAIRLNIPPLTEERRKDMIKRVHKTVEEHRIAVRNVRRDVNEDLKRMEKSHDLSEDDCRRAQERVQKLTDKYMVDLDHVQSAKEKDLLEI